ncbi:hypothetical protein E2C01_099243 [Portunus trituberculatus]|uniref:Uncharacterized protein n=1 Tax=Portunus trituberculatus TaxID=210409 RepID=A0A5B7K3C9_PORTR|nr:hypothetical protein [Portunus trituberculatus]
MTILHKLFLSFSYSIALTPCCSLLNTRTAAFPALLLPYVTAGSKVTSGEESDEDSVDSVTVSGKRNTLARHQRLSKTIPDKNYEEGQDLELL